jgi:hypothetical protein
MAPQPNSLPAPSAPRPQSELLAAPDSLLQAGEAVARRASAPATRVTYASAYRAVRRLPDRAAGADVAAG